jgi:hypothetical protein
MPILGADPAFAFDSKWFFTDTPYLWGSWRTAPRRHYSTVPCVLDVPSSEYDRDAEVGCEMQHPVKPGRRDDA